MYSCTFWCSTLFYQYLYKKLFSLSYKNKAGVTTNSNDANQDDDEFNSDFVWHTEEEVHANPVIELTDKSLFKSSVILLDDFRYSAVRNSVDALEKFLQHGILNSLSIIHKYVCIITDFKVVPYKLIQIMNSWVFTHFS